MKVKVWCDSGANIHSCKESTYDIEDLGLTEEELNEMSDEEKETFFKEIALDNFEWGFTFE